jgi:hypothetical protein
LKQQSFLTACLGNAGAALGEVLAERMRHKSRVSAVLLRSIRTTAGRVGELGGQPIDLMRAMSIKGFLESLAPFCQRKCAAAVICDTATAFKIWVPVFWPAMVLMIGRWQPRRHGSGKHALCQGADRPDLVQHHQGLSDQGHIQKGCKWQDFHWDARPSATNTNLAGHEALAIGYDDLAGMALMQGSYGPEVADGGFFGLPYELFGDMVNGVSTAFCSIKDTVGNVPIADYLPVVWDQSRAVLIRQYVTTRLAEIAETARTPGIDVRGPEMDHAMGWPAGTSQAVLRVG